VRREAERLAATDVAAVIGGSLRFLAPSAP
jgi:hypothetical protein